MKHEAVREVVVIAREEEAGEKRLVAYLVGASDAAVSQSELRKYLKERLPEYMVPSAYVKLEQMPMTANGKLDRKALPAPEYVSGGSPEAQELTPVEEIVAGIWSSVQKVEVVSATADFFEMGGHSLLATQVISRVRAAFDVELGLRAIFETPMVAGLAQQVEEARRAGQTKEVPAIEKADRSRELALSYAQQRLWFIEQLEAGSALYNMPTALLMTGEVSLAALEQSLTEIVRRHEVLRTSFVTAAGEARQQIEPACGVELEIIDLRALAEGERAAASRAAAKEEAERWFDLSRGPMLRAKVVRLAQREQVLLVTMHHIASDGWSTGILIKEFTSLYEAYKGGEASGLAELGLQYADFAVWQRSWLEGEVLDEQLNYWRQALEGAAVLELPTDYPRPARATHRGAAAGFLIEEELTRHLKELSRRQGATLFMSLLAAFQVLLSRYANQADVSVGTPIANRNHLETEGLIGFFINQLVLRSDLGGNPTFIELLERVRETVLGAYEHQDLPFEKLVEELQPQRDLSRAPLFQVMLVLQNAVTDHLQLTGLELSGLNREEGYVKFDLNIVLQEHKTGLTGLIKYSTDLFAQETIERMTGHLKVLLAALVVDPEQAVSTLPLLTEAERYELTRLYNDTAVAYPSDQCIHELFTAQAQRTPDAVAVVDEEAQVSYGELDRRSNQLGHYLREMGVGAEQVVGLCMRRSVEMVVGLLGILKSGGAYLPLEPDYPMQRLAFMLEDAQVAVLLTQQALLPHLQHFTVKQICLDTQWEEISQQSITA